MRETCQKHATPNGRWLVSLFVCLVALVASMLVGFERRLEMTLAPTETLVCVCVCVLLKELPVCTGKQVGSPDRAERGFG